jgi:hypothetical protein
MMIIYDVTRTGHATTMGPENATLFIGSSRPMSTNKK